ncbi:uncharacterized protein LOC126980985 [Eriocheir sinensis]|uniref:uncharacterized protein LOC126980985 n=1 Tax=Eriocheir sinensis TaxID=95602 RepID=UPI0021C82817|nr:uncharacterized protein LOC126980985 [Eriocheir sinensis]
MRSSRCSRSVKPLAGEGSTTCLVLLASLLLARSAAALAAVEEAPAVLQAEGTRSGPAWLEARSPASEVATSRVRRFVPFPASSTLEATLKLILPVTGKIGLSTVVLATAFVFKLPTEYLSLGRSYKDTAADERAFLYTSIESFLDGLGYDGRSCTLRTLCEIAEAPFEHDLYGEVINLVLSASLSPNNSVEYDDYMLAEHYGRNYGDCGAIYHTCPTSVLDLISQSI